jgi:hypothetical protein
LQVDYRGARGSNAGDDFHELWAVRQALRLLSADGDLKAITLEGIADRDTNGAPPASWDGVDCALYFGGYDAREASSIELLQLKYSAADAKRQWTSARLVQEKQGRRGSSVIGGLAKAWKGVRAARGDKPGLRLRAALITNQPVDPGIRDALATAVRGIPDDYIRKPTAHAATLHKLVHASMLSTDEFIAFASALDTESSTGSRFKIEEDTLRAISDWSEMDARAVADRLHRFVHRRMLPEAAGERITRESVLVEFGISDPRALFPCPSAINTVPNLVSRAAARKIKDLLLAGEQYTCLHGAAGVGKTTALQEIGASLPPGSLLISFDCYGAGTYLDPSEYRHRPRDAFIHLSNDVAQHLRLPFLLGREETTDYTRAFKRRLIIAAQTLAASRPNALVVVAIDGADNSVAAGKAQSPPEPSFVHDFVRLTELPDNVRFLVGARTGRLTDLDLPRHFKRVELKAFSRDETGENVAFFWPAPDWWVDDFHDLSGGNPRVQSYAFASSVGRPEEALEALRPNGKHLDQIFREQFDHAFKKSGTQIELQRFCAGLISLPRPIPLSELASVLSAAEPALTDICLDLAPGLRLRGAQLSFADEDFEQFIREEADPYLAEISQRVADRLLERGQSDVYAATYVAPALLRAQRGAALLELVEREPAPVIITDPIRRREIEIQRLRLAIKVCREAGDVPRALRFVLIGAEAMTTDAALRDLLSNNADLAVGFAADTASRLVLGNSNAINLHGPLLFQRLAVDAQRGDAISVREGHRQLSAWMQARKDAFEEVGQEHRYPEAWKIAAEDIAAEIYASLLLEGPKIALDRLAGWRPKRVALEVARALIPKLLAENRIELLERCLPHVGEPWVLFLLCPLSVAGRAVNLQLLSNCVENLRRRRLLGCKPDNRSYSSGPVLDYYVLGTVLTACETLVARGGNRDVVKRTLAMFLTEEFRREDRRHTFEVSSLDLLFRAHALAEILDGRTATPETVFVDPPKPKEAPERPRTLRADDHSRELREFAGAVIRIYTVRAQAISEKLSPEAIDAQFGEAVDKLRSDEWRFARRGGSGAMREKAAEATALLHLAGYEPHVLMTRSVEILGSWTQGFGDPLFKTLAALPGLDEWLVVDIARAACEIRAKRIGAKEKSEALIGFSRMLAMISREDAAVVFRDAVQAAAELDSEAMDQLRFVEQLVKRGNAAFAGRARASAQDLGDIVHDAAIRLDGYEGFPWHAAISALTRLDAPLSLAAIARWNDVQVASLNAVLSAFIAAGLEAGSVTAVQASALLCFDERIDGNLVLNIYQAAEQHRPLSIAQLTEELASDVLLRADVRAIEPLADHLAARPPFGPWVHRLVEQERYLRELRRPDDQPPHGPLQPDKEGAVSALDEHIWKASELIQPEDLRTAIEKIQNSAHGLDQYIPTGRILSAAREWVAVKDRVAHLNALVGLEADRYGYEAIVAALEAVGAWQASPAVTRWSRENIPPLVADRFPHFVRYLPWEQDKLVRSAFHQAKASDIEIQKLILAGIERHVEGIGAAVVFATAGIVGAHLEPSEAAELCCWYLRRLADRIAPAEHDRPTDVPTDTESAVARFLFAHMSDLDLRLRWKAAHAVRRLARNGEHGTLAKLVSLYDRIEEQAFRGEGLPFYWIAARLWLVIALDRIAQEAPVAIAPHAAFLFNVATSTDFPHVLLRAFARDAYAKLVESGAVAPTEEALVSLSRVNKSPMRNVVVARRYGADFGYSDEGRRFGFDYMDTLRYWYAPLLRVFADLGPEEFLKAAETWLVDRWTAAKDTRRWEREPRQGRLSERSYSLSDHSHGARPTLERYHTYLEWQAMWCATGELLKTRALAHIEQDDWDSLYHRIKQEQLTHPPIWLADIAGPKPLEVSCWRGPDGSISDWVTEAADCDFLAEMMPAVQSGYLAVACSRERRSRDFNETIYLLSALVSPETAPALVRALQTAEDYYRVPTEGHDREIDEPPYRFIGWLREDYHDSGIDEKDTFRNGVHRIAFAPGRRITQRFKLTQELTQPLRWFAAGYAEAAFVYEAWGGYGDEGEQIRYSDRLISQGYRLLVRKEVLIKFLDAEEADLLVKVEIKRSGRGFDDPYDKKEKQESRFDRVILARRGGSVEAAERCLGAWAPPGA